MIYHLKHTTPYDVYKKLVTVETVEGMPRINFNIPLSRSCESPWGYCLIAVRCIHLLQRHLLLQ